MPVGFHCQFVKFIMNPNKCCTFWVCVCVCVWSVVVCVRARSRLSTVGKVHVIYRIENVKWKTQHLHGHRRRFRRRRWWKTSELGIISNVSELYGSIENSPFAMACGMMEWDRGSRWIAQWIIPAVDSVHCSVHARIVGSRYTIEHFNHDSPFWERINLFFSLLFCIRRHRPCFRSAFGWKWSNVNDAMICVGIWAHMCCWGFIWLYQWRMRLATRKFPSAHS